MGQLEIDWTNIGLVVLSPVNPNKISHNIINYEYSRRQSPDPKQSWTEFALDYGRNGA
jgi:hypothetical protein